MHRESTGVHQLFQEDGKLAIASENPNSGDKYLAVFNISDDPEPKEIKVDMTALGYVSDCALINLWTGEDSGQISGEFSVSLEPHACGLYKIVY